MKFAIKKSASQYWWCEAPEIVLAASSLDEVAPVLAEVERLQQAGYLVAGWISYEASPAFNARAVVHTSENFPLLVMMATRDCQVETLPDLHHDPVELHPCIEQNEYLQRFDRLIELIHSGDLYQANYSFRAKVEMLGSGFELFCHLERDHPMPHAGYIQYGDLEIVSLSPELFLKREGSVLSAEPMKGTAPRGKSFDEDEAQRLWLESDIKNRAENVMIVDLMRNDLSKVCLANSVETPLLFSARRFHSLHQMVSEVRGRVQPEVTLFEILRATFPAGSITGTPKIRSMEVIRDIESSPRKAYTGSVGVFLPDGDFSLNVAIRTLLVDGRGQPEGSSPDVEIGIGSGVVSQSDAEAEWRECLLKGDFLNYRYRHSEVFETMLWQQGYHYLTEHLDRLKRSCDYFLTPCDIDQARDLLIESAREFDQAMRVRLAVRRDGSFNITTVPLDDPGWGDAPLKLLLSAARVNENDPYQFHKTDCRRHYDEGLQKAIRRGFSEMLFFNQQNLLAEGAISNVFIQTDESWITPPIAAGILPGIWRQAMMDQLDAKTATIDRTQLLNARRILVGNSVRGAGEVGELHSEDGLLWSGKPATAQRH